MKKNIIIIGVAAVAALAGYTAFVISGTKSEVLNDLQAKADLKNATLTYLTQEHTADEIENTLLSAFKQLDKEDNTQILDALIYGTYSAASSVMMSDEETDVLYQIMDEDKNFNSSLIEDTEIREIVDTLGEQHVIPRYVNGNMFYDVDYGYFAETFGDYINPDYREVLEFYNLEKEEDYVNVENNLLITDVVTERLDTLYAMLQEYSDSELIDIINDLYTFYKAIYFGAYSQDYVFTDDAKIRENVLESYNEYKGLTLDSDLSVFMESLTEMYNEADDYRTVPIMESIKDFCGLNEAAAGIASDSEASAAEGSSDDELTLLPNEEAAVTAEE